MATILVIEDDEDMSRYMTYLLSSAGHSVLQASDGKKALRLIHEHQPDCITLDIYMDEMDGLETLRNLRRSSKTIPVVIVSGSAEQYLLGICRHLGVSAFLTKPFENQRLFSSVEAALC